MATEKANRNTIYQIFQSLGVNNEHVNQLLGDIILPEDPFEIKQSSGHVMWPGVHGIGS